MTVEALMDKEGMQAYTAAEKVELLRPKSYPMNDDDEYGEPLPVRSAHPPVTEHALE